MKKILFTLLIGIAIGLSFNYAPPAFMLPSIIRADSLQVIHRSSLGATPTAAIDAPPGTVTSITVSGKDMAMKITVVVASGQVVSGSLGTITFASAWTSAPIVNISPSNAGAAGTQISAGSSNGSTITLTAFNLAAGSYEYNIQTSL